MTFNTAAWAIDGALTKAALARTSSYGESGAVEGVVALDHLKVTQLATPGRGFQVAAGGALVLNRYQTSPSQTYTVLNDAVKAYGSSDVPAVNAGAISHLICVVVGDPEFSQTGHPFMLASDPPAGQESTFQYVRVFVVPNVPSTTKTFAQLGFHYPAYAIARVDLPAGVDTYTDARLVDLRKVARPRRDEDVYNAAASGTNQLGNAVNVYENWPSSASWNVDIPSWATEAQVFAVVEGARKKAAGVGGLQVSIANAGVTSPTNINEPAPSGSSDREAYVVIGKIAIPASVRGTTQAVRIQGKVSDTPSKFFLETDTNTSAMLRLMFRETAV